MTIDNFSTESKTVVNTGGHHTNPPAPTTSPPPIRNLVVPKGKGNLLYVATFKGVAKCVNAYAGSPVWSAVNTGLSTVAATTIRWFNLDPFSLSAGAATTGIGHFQSGWVMTDAGLYRATGLPNPTWTSVLTSAQAAALLGMSAANVALGLHFEPSVIENGKIVTWAYAVDNPTTPTWTRGYCLWSNDHGVTWNANTSYWLRPGDPFVLNTVNLYNNMIRTYASPHIAGAWYAYLHYTGGTGNTGLVDQTGQRNGQIWKSTSLPRFVPAVALESTLFGNMVLTDIHFPFYDQNGKPLGTDDRMYARGGPSSGTGIYGLRYYSNLFNPAYPSGQPKLGTGVGDANMSEDNLNAGGWRWIFANALNQKYLIFTTPTETPPKAYFSSNMAASWSRNTITVGGRTLTPNYLFMVLADPLINFLFGPGSVSGVAMAVMTKDFGSTFTDFSLYGQAGALDTVLGLALGDVDNPIIMVDYYQT